MRLFKLNPKEVEVRTSEKLQGKRALVVARVAHPNDSQFAGESFRKIALEGEYYERGNTRGRRANSFLTDHNPEVIVSDGEGFKRAALAPEKLIISPDSNTVAKRNETFTAFDGVKGREETGRIDIPRRHWLKRKNP